MVRYMMKPIKRRARRTSKKNWTEEIVKGNIEGFYNSTEWSIVREQVIMRDKGICQFFAGKFVADNGVKPYKIKLTEGTHVHHIKELKDYPHLGLDIDNLVLLSHLGHEIVHDRYVRKKRIINKEKW